MPPGSPTTYRGDSHRGHRCQPVDPGAEEIADAVDRHRLPKPSRPARLLLFRWAAAGSTLKALSVDDIEGIGTLGTRSGPLSPFIIGNVVWIFGEALQTILDALYELSREPVWFGLPWYWYGFIARALFSVISIGFFIASIRRMWKKIPAVS